MSDDRQPYGYVLVLRALASAAIDLKSSAALRVFCVLAEYSDMKGKCSVSHGTIAERLGISRQAVQRSIDALWEDGFVQAERRPGRAFRYEINIEHVREDRQSEPTAGTWRWAERQKRNPPSPLGPGNPNCLWSHEWGWVEVTAVDGDSVFARTNCGERTLQRGSLLPAKPEETCNV